MKSEAHLISWNRLGELLKLYAFQPEDHGVIAPGDFQKFGNDYYWQWRDHSAAATKVSFKYARKARRKITRDTPILVVQDDMVHIPIDKGGVMRIKFFMPATSSILLHTHWDSHQRSEPTCSKLLDEIERLTDALDWQNKPNLLKPVRSGYEFYVNEEWSCLRDAALGTDVGFSAALYKTRIDPDDERVRVRRVIDDDLLLRELEDLRSQLTTQQTQNGTSKTVF